MTTDIQRLYNAAEAFYFAGILTSSRFDASRVDMIKHREANAAAEAVRSESKNDLGAPPIVNFAFSVELYLKLLIGLAGRSAGKDHKLYELFLVLDKVSPSISSAVIDDHFYARGDRKWFLGSLEHESNAFVEWRYAHEKPFLASSADTFYEFANACRKTINRLWPSLRSAFVLDG